MGSLITHLLCPPQVKYIKVNIATSRLSEEVSVPLLIWEERRIYVFSLIWVLGYVDMLTCSCDVHERNNFL